MAVLSAMDDESKTLVVSGFDLGVPNGADILGVTVTILRRGDNDQVRDDELHLAPGGNPGGADYGDSRKWPMTFGSAAYGGAADTWGLALTAAALDDAAFGVALRARHVGGATSAAAEVDQIEVAVTYCK